VANLRTLFPLYGWLLEKSAPASHNPISKKECTLLEFVQKGICVAEIPGHPQRWYTIALGIWEFTLLQFRDTLNHPKTRWDTSQTRK
jgi:hypothetical protein